MAPYDDWNNIDEEDEELQDSSVRNFLIVWFLQLTYDLPLPSCSKQNEMLFSSV
jgi:hypothetical protein